MTKFAIDKQIARSPGTARFARAVSLVLFVQVAPAVAASGEWPSWMQSAETVAQGTPSGLDAAVGVLTTLAPQSATAIAAHATPEGHWQFRTRAGDTYTAGTPEEMVRAPGVVLPDSPDGFASAILVLSLDSLFTGTAVLKSMPVARDLRVAVAGVALPLRKSPSGGYAVAIRPLLALVANDRALFAEAQAQLDRPLDAARIRVLAANTGSDATLPTRPRFDAVTGAAAIDTIDPDHLADGMSAIAGQMAVITARIDGAALTVAPAAGPERAVPMAPVLAAAAAADIDLIILSADPPRQPGTRTWLWQQVAIGGLDHARKRGTLADFLTALAPGTSGVTVTAAADGNARIHLAVGVNAAPLVSTAGVTDWIRAAAGTVVAPITGIVEPGAIDVRLVGSSRRLELQRRLVPWLPSQVQLGYAVLAILGLSAWPITTRWWQRIWPREARAEYASASGYLLARGLRGLAYIAVFLPLAALPAALTGVAWLVLGTRSRAGSREVATEQIQQQAKGGTTRQHRQ